MTKGYLLPEVIKNMPIAAFVYELLLLLYPKKYREEYASEMRQVFYDLYEEERDRKGRTGVGFWSRVIWDVGISTVDQHNQLASKIGMRRYFAEVWGLNT